MTHFPMTFQICAGLQRKLQATLHAGPWAEGLGREASPCGYGLVQLAFAAVAPERQASTSVPGGRYRNPGEYGTPGRWTVNPKNRNSQALSQLLLTTLIHKTNCTPRWCFQRLTGLSVCHVHYKWSLFFPPLKQGLCSSSLSSSTETQYQQWIRATRVT